MSVGSVNPRRDMPANAFKAVGAGARGSAVAPAADLLGIVRPAESIPSRAAGGDAPVDRAEISPAARALSAMDKARAGLFRARWLGSGQTGAAAGRATGATAESAYGLPRGLLANRRDLTALAERFPGPGAPELMGRATPPASGESGVGVDEKAGATDNAADLMGAAAAGSAAVSGQMTAAAGVDNEPAPPAPASPLSGEEDGEAAGREAEDAIAPATENEAGAAPEDAEGDDKAAKENEPTSPGGKELGEDELRQVDELKARDREVRTHEQAHIAAGGSYVRGGASYDYQQGPDGKRYAVGGEVSIDVGPEKDPAATIEKMRQVRAAAMAPAEPSGQDRQVAAAAMRQETAARRELGQQRRAEAQAAARAARAAQPGREGQPEGGESESGMDAAALDPNAASAMEPEPPAGDSAPAPAAGASLTAESPTESAAGALGGSKSAPGSARR